MLFVPRREVSGPPVRGICTDRLEESLVQYAILDCLVSPSLSTQASQGMEEPFCLHLSDHDRVMIKLNLALCTDLLAFTLPPREIQENLN